MAIRWVILDAMGVVFEAADDVETLLVPFLQKRNGALTHKQIHAAYYRASLGEISAAAFWDTVGFGANYPAIQNEYLNSRLTLDPGCRPVLQRLQREYKLALLSNDIGEWSAHLRTRHELDTIFDTTVISGDVGCRKPDHGIFQIVCERTNATPDTCVFVDDRKPNLDSAAACGFRTIRFRRGSAADVASAHRVVSSFATLPEAVTSVFQDS